MLPPPPSLFACWGLIYAVMNQEHYLCRSSSIPDQLMNIRFNFTQLSTHLSDVTIFFYAITTYSEQPQQLDDRQGAKHRQGPKQEDITDFVDGLSTRP